MRFTTSTIVVALLSLSAKLVVAVPPACLLAAVSTEQNPSDLDLLCGSDSSKVQHQIQNLCGGATQVALKAYQSTCSSAGKQVSIICASSSTSKSSTTGSPSKNSTIVLTSSFYDSSCSCTKTTQISTTTAVSSVASATVSSTSGGSGSGSEPGSASGTSSSPSSQTGGAVAGTKGKMGSLMAGVIAVAGVAITL